jgi:RNA polymerase sigma factor (sigma-70 family)
VAEVIDNDTRDSSEVIMEALRRYVPMSKSEEDATICIMLNKQNSMKTRVEARNKLIKSHSRLIFGIAMQYAKKTNKPVEDLFQAGILGAMLKSMEYEPNMNVKFTSFVIWSVRAFILEEISLQNDLIHCSRAKRDQFTTKKGREAILNSDDPKDVAFRRAIARPFSLYDPIGTGNGTHSEDSKTLWLETIGKEDEKLEEIFNSSEDEELGRLIERTLEPVEMTILRNGLVNGMNDVEVGELISRSRERIRQRRDRSLKKIAAEIRKAHKCNGYVYNNNVDTCRIDKVFR